jgi:hypothetical protein
LFQTKNHFKSCNGIKENNTIMTLYHIAIIVLALIGIGINANHLYKRKKDEERKPFDQAGENDPAKLIKYSLFLEIPIELLVMVGFIIIAGIHTFLLLSGITAHWLELVVLGITGITFLMLVYETGMQIFVFKNFSFEWISSSILCVIIFLLAETLLEPQLTEILTASVEYLLTFHLLGMVLGLGGTTVIDLMFFHFIKDYQITKREAVIMHLISQMIILGLGLLVLTGVGLFLTNPGNYATSPRFLAKMSAMVVVILNGAALNLYITPKMKHISFLSAEERRKHETLKMVAFALGAISMVSWYSAFIFAMVKDLGEFSYPTLLIAYLIILVIAIAGSQATRKYFIFKAKIDEHK